MLRPYLPRVAEDDERMKYQRVNHGRQKPWLADRDIVRARRRSEPPAIEPDDVTIVRRADYAACGECIGKCDFCDMCLWTTDIR
jgi:hypothetical protein